MRAIQVLSLITAGIPMAGWMTFDSPSSGAAKGHQAASPSPCLSPSDSDFAVRLDRRKRLWLVQSKTAGIYSLALAHADKLNPDCRRSVATMTAPAGEYFEYACVDTTRPKEVILGTMSTSEGRPRAAWLIDYGRSTFVSVPTKSVTCKNEGYELDGDDPRWDLRTDAAKRRARKK